MQFQKGQRGNPAGRPPGARNWATIIAETLLQGEAEALTRIVPERAKAGDMAPRAGASIVCCLCPRIAAFCSNFPRSGARPMRPTPGCKSPPKSPRVRSRRRSGRLFQAVDGVLQMRQVTDFEERVARLERAAAIAAPPSRPEGHGGAQDVAGAGPAVNRRVDGGERKNACRGRIRFILRDIGGAGYGPSPHARQDRERRGERG